MTKRTNLFRSLARPREMHLCKIAGISFLLLCAAPQFMVAYTYENTAVTTTQQSKTEKITGVIIDTNGEAIIGASIKVQGSSTLGTVTNLEGEFTLNVPPRSMLEISYIGYKKLVVSVGKEKHLRLTLEEDTKTLDEVIVIGYGTTSKRKTTSAISSVDAESIAKAPVANVTQSLAGKAPGLIVSTSGGGIGNYSTISIRGGGTPLVVIDDIISEYRDFQNLNPEDIDQLTILKDASSTAVYGARAANGILMVVTKQGKAGKMSINYNFNYNMSQPTTLPKKYGSYDAAYYLNMSQTNDGNQPTYTPEQMEKFRTGSDPYAYPNVDWQDICLRSFAPEQRHSLTLSGGSEKVKAFTSLSYYDQQSIYKFNTNNMQRYNMRTNLVTDFKEIGLKVTAGMDGYIYQTEAPVTQYGSGYGSVWSHIQNKKPWELAYNEFGQYYVSTDHPLVEISPEGGYNHSEMTSVKANLVLDWMVPGVPGLKLKALGNYYTYNDRTKIWNKTPNQYDLEGNPNNPNKPSLSKSVWSTSGFTTQFFANYDRTFGKHTVGATAGIEATGNKVDNVSLSREEYLLIVDQIEAGPVATAKNGSYEDESARAGVIGRIKYDYASKYVVEASIRYDGSDLFPKGKRWGAFYSGSAAWVLSEEFFWQTLKDKHIFDQFKIRGSYGEIGLDNIDRYSYLASYTPSERGYLIDGSFVPGFSEGAMVSKDITWYTSKSMNIGFDFGSLNNRLSGSVDYFRMATTGYLASPSNVGYTGPLGTSLPNVKTNGESIRQGAEFILQWKEKRGDFEYVVSGNLTYFDSFYNINPFESEVNLKNPYIRSTQAKGYWGTGLTSLGYYSSQEDVMNSAKRPGSVNLGAGDIKYQDFNGDGIIDSSDNHRIGKNGFPRCNYGINVDLNYKGWFLNMLWQGATQNDLYMGNMIQGDASSGYLPVIYKFQSDTWTPSNTDSRYPRLRSSKSYNGNNNYQQSDFWLVNAAYIRLKNLSVGYDFKNRLLKRTAWLTKCNLALSGYNLLTFSPASKFGMDPEIGNGNLYTYPVSRVYSISINLGF